MSNELPGYQTQLPDFDTLMKLHQEDPEAFEHFRTKVFEDVVKNAPDEHHRAIAEKTIASINEARAKAKDPMDAAKTAFNMMTKSVADLKDAWHDCQEAACGLQAELIIQDLQMRSKGITKSGEQ